MDYSTNSAWNSIKAGCLDPLISGDPGNGLSARANKLGALWYNERHHWEVNGERPFLGTQHKDIKVLFFFKRSKFQAVYMTYRHVSRGLYLINISRRLNDSHVNNALLL